MTDDPLSLNPEADPSCEAFRGQGRASRLYPGKGTGHRGILAALWSLEYGTGLYEEEGKMRM
jgi:hypothetical protein